MSTLSGIGSIALVVVATLSMAAGQGRLTDEDKKRLVPGVQIVDPATVGDDFDWDDGTPLQFLEHLKERRHYTVANPHRHWVKHEQVPQLIALFDSTDRCASVSGSWSSLHDTRLSTIGNEAAFLVEGAKRNSYPPWPHSLQFEYSQEDKEELRRWWREASGGGK
jgi:hypothetical protein